MPKPASSWAAITSRSEDANTRECLCTNELHQLRIEVIVDPLCDCLFRLLIAQRALMITQTALLFAVCCLCVPRNLTIQTWLIGSSIERTKDAFAKQLLDRSLELLAANARISTLEGVDCL